MRQLASILLLLLLCACSGPQLPFAKEDAAEGNAAVMVTPPWETFVQAGPGAASDVDLETLNGPLVQPPLVPPSLVEEQVADAVVPDNNPVVAKNSNAVTIRYVAVPLVKGSNAKGNADLTAAMRAVLQEAGWPVLTAAREDALTVQGRIDISAAAGGSQTVKLVWDVTTPQGKRLGDVKQENAVTAGSLDQGWGENARFASEAAAEGIFKLIQQFR